MIVALLLAAAALVSPPPSGMDGACDLHLFALDTGGEPRSQGNAMVRPVAGSDDPLAFINVMSPHDRMVDVSDAHYRSALGLGADTAVVRHWDVPVDASIRKSTTPLVPTPGRCHHELAGYYASGFAPARSVSGKAEVYVNLLLRSFAPDGAMTFKVDKGGEASIETEKKVGRTAALASLQAGSIAILDDFSRDVAKARAKVTQSMKKDAR